MRRSNKTHSGEFRPSQSRSHQVHPTPVHRVRPSYLLAGGTVLAAAGLFINPQTHFNNDRLGKTTQDVCQEIVQPKSALTREQLTQLLATPERSNKTAVQAIVRAPYCRLSSVEIREGVPAQRDAYPLAFDPQIRVVLLYEGNEYVGYGFAFQR